MDLAALNFVIAMYAAMPDDDELERAIIASIQESFRMTRKQAMMVLLEGAGMCGPKGIYE